MDNWFGFSVNAAGEIEGGPEGWTSELNGYTYVVTHNSGVKLIPTLTAIGRPNDTTGNFTTPQLVDVGENSFSWKNHRNMIGSTTNNATAVSVIVPPEYFGGGE
jgi:hypothetical protein